MAADYAERIPKWGLASLEDVAAAAAKPDTVFLDVRSDGEVAVGHAPPPGSPTGPPHPLGCPRLLTRAVRQDSPLPRDYVHCPVTMGDTSQLAARAAELLPDKSASIICFCGVGGRAMGAKKTLEEAGYTGVLNAVRAALPPPGVPPR